MWFELYLCPGFPKAFALGILACGRHFPSQHASLHGGEWPSSGLLPTGLPSQPHPTLLTSCLSLPCAKVIAMSCCAWLLFTVLGIGHGVASCPVILLGISIIILLGIDFALRGDKCLKIHVRYLCAVSPGSSPRSGCSLLSV